MGTIESLGKSFYIMDNSGNYYRLNQDGQLVIAGGKNDACFFTYEEAYQKIGNGKRAHFYKIVASDTVSENAMQNTHAKDITPCPYEESGNENANFEYKQPIWKENYISRWNMPDLSDLSGIDWLSYLQYFGYINSNVDVYESQLLEAESTVDQTISDLLHYVEFHTLDDMQMREIMDEIKAARECRRDIKNELARIGHFRSSLGTSENARRTDEAVRAVLKLEARNYRPRVLKNLFQFTSPEEKRNTGSFQEMMERYEGRDPFFDSSSDYPDSDYVEDSFHGKVDREFRPTIFDDCSPDWAEFVKMQAAFFRQISQYIQNLEIDLENKDALIESALKECENANYNVAQGYKAFKNLKNLRNERREKLVQLQQVQVIADHFDCNCMKDIYEEIEAEFASLSGSQPPSTHNAETVKVSEAV